MLKVHFRFICLPDCTEIEKNWTLRPEQLKEGQEHSLRTAFRRLLVKAK